MDLCIFLFDYSKLVLNPQGFSPVRLLHKLLFIQIIFQVCNRKSFVRLYCSDLNKATLQTHFKVCKMY